MSNSQVIAASAVGAAVVGAAAAYTVSTYSVRPHLLRATGALSADLIRRWAETRAEIRLGPIPENARLVPVVDRISTPLVPRGTDVTTRQGAAVYFQALRTALDRAGRGAEDVRCAGLLTAIESAWGRVGWNNNLNNVKSQGTVYARSVDEVVSTRQVYTTNLEADGVYLLIDRVNSLDGYHSYSNLETYMRRSKMLLQRVYPGVVEAWESGGLDGLLRGEDILGGSNPRGARYSGAPSVARMTTARWYWSRWSRIMGAEFVR